ncbi:MAG: flagellar protein FlaG [Pseudomonadota bacterium]
MDGVNFTGKLPPPSVSRAEPVRADIGGRAAGHGQDAQTPAPVGPTGRAPENRNDPKDPFAKVTQMLGEALAGRIARSKLQIERDEASGRFIYKAVDVESGEVTRQFPPEEVLRILAFYRNPEGLVIDDKA